MPEAIPMTRPALLLCSAYDERIARIQDQDLLYTITRRIKDRLEPLPERHAP